MFLKRRFISTGQISLPCARIATFCSLKAALSTRHTNLNQFGGRGKAMNCAWIKEQICLLNKKLILNGWIVCSNSHNNNILSLRDVLASSVNIQVWAGIFLIICREKIFLYSNRCVLIYFLIILSLKFKRRLLFLVHSQLL